MARRDLARAMVELLMKNIWMERLLESMVEGVVTLDENLHITYFNHGAERITGWNREQALHRACDTIFLVAEEDIAFSQCLPPIGQQNQVVVKATDDHQVNLSITCAQLKPEDGEKPEIALVFRDVSTQAAIRRQLGHFTANIAHEFRSPLSALAASIELLQDQAPDLSAAEVGELLESLHLSVLSLQNLVDNLLEGASLEAGHFRISPRPSELFKIIEEAAQTMQPLLEKYAQHLVVEGSAGLPLVHADPRRIVQVLVNLISNASKYGPEGGEISLNSRLAGEQVEVRVADHGPGTASHYGELSFHRFEIPNSPGDPTKAGAGLGLSVVKAIVEAHGGKFGMSDRPDGGSIFWFTLLAAQDA